MEKVISVTENQPKSSSQPSKVFANQFVVYFS
jgi:hypothetical protein